MQSVPEVMKAISEYGILIVIASIFLYVAIRVINIWLKGLESKVGNKKHDKLIDIRTSVDAKVQDALDSFLVKSHGDRVQVIEFSNSVMSVAYLPFKYMTCTYEVYRVGKSSSGSSIDRLSTSLFTTFFINLQTNDYCIIDETTDGDSVGGAMMELIHNSGEPNALCALMRTPRGKSIGYVMLKKSTEFTDEDVEGIQDLSQQVSALLGVVDK